MLVHEFVSISPAQMVSLFGQTQEYCEFFDVSESGKEQLVQFLGYLANRSGLQRGALNGNSLNDCDNGCGYVPPYGFVPECGCPVHDPNG